MMIMTWKTNSIKMYFKQLLVVLAALQVCNYVNGSNGETSLVPGIPIIPFRSLAAGIGPRNIVDKESCDAEKLFDCKNCSTRMICDTAGTVLATRPCSGLTPYCNGGICVEDRPESCPAPVSPLCPVANQVYPSPASCQRYIKCDANRLPTEYQCPGTLVYDPQYYLCKRQNFNRDCPVLNCTENRGKFISYPLQPDIYLYCGLNGEPKILQCASKSEEFNAAELRCEPKCDRSGLLAATNKREYYVCAYNYDGLFDKYLMTCPNDTKFNSTIEGCA